MTKNERLAQSPSAGFSLVEVLLATALFSLLVGAFAGAIIYSQQTSQSANRRVRAAMLLEEGLESVRSIRDRGFAELSDGTYGLQRVAGGWALAESPDITGEFSRSVTITSQSPQSKDAAVEVRWVQGAQGTSTVAGLVRLTDWREN